MQEASGDFNWGQSCMSTMCSLLSPPKERPSSKSIWRWEARLVTDKLSSDSAAFRKSFMLKTAPAPAVHLDGDILPTATTVFTWRTHRRTQLRHVAPMGFLCTQEMWMGYPFPPELRFASPMQISTDLCCWTIGMCSSQGKSKDEAVSDTEMALPNVSSCCSPWIPPLPEAQSSEDIYIHPTEHLPCGQGMCSHCTGREVSWRPQWNSWECLTQHSHSPHLDIFPPIPRPPLQSWFLSRRP